KVPSYRVRRWPTGGSGKFGHSSPADRSGDGVVARRDLFGGGPDHSTLSGQSILPHDPMVAAAWMGLAVKTDGAAAASGAITQGLFQTDSVGSGWMLMTTITVKVFIDVFIGVWAFVLALVWVYGIHKKEGQQVSAAEIWQRFPKFVIGYFLTFL